MNKGKLRVVKGDATCPQMTTNKEIVMIPHVCNDEKKWGAGFVLALNRKWEYPERRYKEFCERNKNVPILGKVCYAKIDEHLVVANMIAQDGTVSADNPKPIRYKALVNCMAEVESYIEMIRNQVSNPIVIHCPKFGSDLAGGNWDFILELIDEIWLNAGIDVVVYEYDG